MPPLLHPFYPVVPDLSWIEKLLPLGVKTVQLRLKDKDEKEISQQISAALLLASKYNCTLIINDYWQQAIDLNADFIHLGQEDLQHADMQAIRRAGLKIGLSTHSHEEFDTALAAEPDYVALGPIWETKLKKMKWHPQGLERLSEWDQKSPVPVVAIGGITLERAPKTFTSGAASIAVVTDIVASDNPAGRTKAWLELTRQK